MNKRYSISGKHIVIALAVASGLSIAPVGAEAAGLGRITVFSALGQPLRAEVEVSATRAELIGMTARMAPVDAFRQAGVDYSGSLGQLRFAFEKRGKGAVVKVSSDKPVNEPFLDFLLELNWPSGRLVREYTFLLDPPEVAAQASRRKAIADARTVPALPAGRDGGEIIVKPEPSPKAETQPKAAPEKQKSEGAAAPAGSATGEAAGTHVVKSGENLRRIAGENLPAGVSLEQMLVALYRNNADAFTGKNMNRLRAGAVLQIPSKEEAGAVSEAEARKVFQAQSSDWNSYRRKLASAAEHAPATDTAASRETSGKITAKVEDKAAPAEQPKDQVKVSKTVDTAKGKGGASEEELIAKEKSLKEAQQRLNMLEKNVSELQKLLEMKNQNIAELQKQLSKAPAPASALKPLEPLAKAPEIKPEPVPAPKPEIKPELVTPVKPEVKAEVPPKPEVQPVQQPVIPKVEEPPKPVEAAAVPVVEPVKPVEPVVEAEKPVEPAPPPPPPAEPKKRPPPPPPPPPEEPGFVDGLMDNLIPLLAGGGLLAAIAGFLVYRRRRGESGETESVAASETPEPTSSIGPNSVFQTAGGQSVDTTNNTTPPTTDFSQAGPGAIDTDEVDPVAEADVYMAYGRDAQAEEILLDALQKDPQRIAIHCKLLEIYAGRRSVKQFETLASELYSQTGGQGGEWDKVAALGRSLDPANPLYGGAGPKAGASSFNADATLVVASTEALKSLKPEPMPEVPTLPEETDPLLSLPQEAEASPPGAELTSLDFDLGVAEETPVVTAVEAEVPRYVETVTNAALVDGGLDFDLGSPSETTEPAETESLSQTIVAPEVAEETLDFDLGLTSPDEGELQFTPAGTMVDGDLGRTSGLDIAAAPAEIEQPGAAAEMIDFELNVPEAPVQPRPSQVSTHQGGTAAVEPMAPLEPDEDMEFDVRLTDSTVLGSPLGAGGFDLSTIDLDLEADATALGAAEETPASDVSDSRRDEVNTKLDLAKAYEDMGDLEGARELLNEVVGEGAPDQVEQARAALSRLSA